MSMLSLQAQLAALNGSSGKHPGSNYASSRRHEDALGRGLHFRPGHGHAITETIRFKASVIYETAEQAARVPLRTLEENGQQAAAASFDGTPLFGDLQLAFSTTDASADTLKSILLQLSTWLGEKNDEIVESCLHIVEYLLRRYKIHLTPQTLEDLLWCFLPHHKQRSPLVHRCLQLIDLAGTNQSYLFLRPYADPKNPVPIPRALLAQHIVKERNLLRRVCSMVREACALVDDDATTTASGEHPDEPVRYGLGYFLSWTAACVVEGLAWQRKAPHRVISDLEREDILRILVPTVRHCCMSTHDARTWGYVVASAAAETMDLGDSVLELWTVAIVEYANDVEGVDNNNNIMSGLDVDIEAWTALLSILVPPLTGTRLVGIEDEDTYLPLLQGKWLGCPLPKSTFDMAMMQKSLAVVVTALAELYQDLQVAPLLAAFLVRAVKNGNFDFVLALLQEDRLESLWQHPVLKILSSVSCWVATLAATQREQDDRAMSGPKNSNPLEILLQEFHQIDPHASEQGFVHALRHATNEKERMALVRVLENVVSQQLLEEDSSTVLLPHVALVDNDASVRLDAIATLLDSACCSNSHRTRKLLVGMFLRRWSEDDNIGVTKELGRAIRKLVVMSSSSELWFDQEHPQLILTGFYRWIQSKNNTDFLQSCMEMMEAALGEMVCSTNEKQRMIEACFSCLYNKNKRVTTAARKAICKSFGEQETLSMQKVAVAIWKNSLSFATQVHQRLQDGTTKRNNTSLAAEIATLDRCALTILSLVADYPEKLSFGEENARLCLSLLCTLLGSPSTSTLGLENTSKMTECLKCCAPMLTSSKAIIKAVIQLGSLREDYFDSVASGILQTMFDNRVTEKNAGLSPVSIFIEAALQPNLDPIVTCRLIDLAAKYATKGQSPVASIPGIIPCLHMVDNENNKIRVKASSFLESISKRYDSPSVDWSVCGSHFADVQTVYKVIGTLGSGNQSLVVHGESLATLLPKFVKQGRGQETRTAILRLCNLTSQVVSSFKSMPDGLVILPAEDSPQTIQTVSTILKAMELSGEENFPLLERWKTVGLSVIEKVLDQTDPGVVKSFSSLLKPTVSMLRGCYVSNAKVAFSSGPQAGGGRVRTYSLGNVDDVKTLQSYPNQMSSALVAVLKSRTTGGLALVSYLLEDLFLQADWVDRVFSKLDTPIRVQLFAAVVELVGQDLSDIATSTFLRLPFDAEDVNGGLVEHIMSSPPRLSLIACIVRFVTGNAEHMGKSESGLKLLKSLFAALVELNASSQSYEKEDFAYTCYAVVNCLNMLSQSVALPAKPSKSMAKSFPMLRTWQVESEEHALQPFSSKKSRLAPLSLTATLADKYHSELLPTLLVALKGAISTFALVALGQKHRVDLLSKVLGVFWRHSSNENVSFGDVLHDLASSFGQGESRVELVSDLVGALWVASQHSESTGKRIASAVGALASAFLATQINANADDGNEIALHVIRSAPTEAQMPSLVLIFQYIKNLIVGLHDREFESLDEVENPLPSHIDIAAFVDLNKASNGRGLASDAQRRSFLVLLQGMARFLVDCLQTEDVKDKIGNGTAEDDKNCLLLWQGSLWLHTMSQSIEGQDKDENAIWQSLTATMIEVRNAIQSSMPMTLFLASVSRLLEDDARSNLSSQALTLVAERVVDVHPDSAEASLFLGLLPDLCEAIGGHDVWFNSATASNQAALLAAEHIGRVVCLESKDAKKLGDSVHMLENVLGRIADTLDAGSRELGFDRISFGGIQVAHRDLISSLALAAATIIRVVGVRTLPYVPKIVPSLVGALSLANDEIAARDEAKKGTEPRDMQLAVVRAIAAMAESVPQFLSPYLHVLLVNRALLSPSLRSSSDPLLRQALDGLDKSMSLGTPGRLFIPTLGRAVDSASSVDNVHVLMQMFQMSTDGISSRDAGSLKGSIFSFISKALDFEGAAPHGEHPIVKKASASLVSFALKLSEGQLRRLYSALKEWKNAAAPNPDASNTAKRVAFWAISASLVDQIKSLFLPCVSLVVEDISLELSHAVEKLCQTKLAKSADGRKKRRLQDANQEIPYMGCPQILQQVLLFLERLLRADAREGGNWTRSDEGRRYSLFLEPLVKLLHSNLSYEVPGESMPTYREIVAFGDEGHIVGCLTALALAAGDEQLWKPLNHAVLEAASFDGRSEVRIGGLLSLFSLMKSLGEEYMVLLPECLPVLSELLEDNNEEVAGLAREIITLAEELLGENLEDAFRR